MSQVTSTKISLPPCRLQESDLRDIVGLITHGWPADVPADWLRIDVELPNYTAHSVDEVIQNDRLPAVLTNLTINTLLAHGTRVFIHFSAKDMSLRAFGPDATDVQEKSGAIAYFMRQKRPWFWPLPWLLHKINYVLVFAVYVVLGLYGLVLAILTPHQNPASGFILWPFVILTWLALYLGRGFPYSQVRLRSDEAPTGQLLNDDRRKTIVRTGKGVVGFIGFVGAILTIVQFWISLHPPAATPPTQPTRQHINTPPAASKTKPPQPQ